MGFKNQSSRRISSTPDILLQSFGTQPATQKFRPESQQTPKPQRTQQFQQTQPPQSFGVFEAVALGDSMGGQINTEAILRPQTDERPVQQNGDFFGEFPSINLQG